MKETFTEGVRKLQQIRTPSTKVRVRWVEGLDSEENREWHLLGATSVPGFISANVNSERQI